MKCIRVVGQKSIDRVPDKVAEQLMKIHKMEYVPKSLWKEQVRPKVSKTEAIIKKEKIKK